MHFLSLSIAIVAFTFCHAVLALKLSDAAAGHGKLSSKEASSSSCNAAAKNMPHLSYVPDSELKPILAITTQRNTQKVTVYEVKGKEGEVAKLGEYDADTLHAIPNVLLPIHAVQLALPDPLKSESSWFIACVEQLYLTKNEKQVCSHCAFSRVHECQNAAGDGQNHTFSLFSLLPHASSVPCGLIYQPVEPMYAEALLEPTSALLRFVVNKLPLKEAKLQVEALEKRGCPTERNSSAEEMTILPNTFVSVNLTNLKPGVPYQVSYKASAQVQDLGEVFFYSPTQLEAVPLVTPTVAARDKLCARPGGPESEQQAGGAAGGLNFDLSKIFGAGAANPSGFSNGHFGPQSSIPFGK